MSGKLQAEKRPDTAAATVGQLQRQQTACHWPEAVPPIVHEVLNSPGEVLDAETRAFFEPRFGHDFSQVRVHTDARAAVSARAVNALAYTVGQDVVFGDRQHSPRTNPGQQLMAHELVHTIEQSLSNVHALQRQEIPAKATDWKAEVEAAENAAKNPKTRNLAEKLYKELVVRAAKRVVAPSPLVDKKPVAADVVWSWTKTAEWAATTDPKKVSSAPDDYWKWLTFNPAAVQRDESVTVSAIAHELDHAAHAKSLYLQWKSAPVKRAAWPDFWLDHYSKWTEPEKKLTQLGILSALEGLPTKIAPSGIEFRAYVNQFVAYFHKSSPRQQAFLAKGVILFYPLKKQTVKEVISDPGLRVEASRQQVLDYFANPPVSQDQKIGIKRLMASEFRGAQLFRSDDMAALATAFKPIFDFVVDPEERKAARANYKPAAL